MHQQHIDAIMMTIKPGICSIFCQKYNKLMIVDFLREIKFKSVLVEETSNVKEGDAAKVNIKLHPTAGHDQVVPAPPGLLDDEEMYNPRLGRQRTFAIMEDALQVARKEARAESEKMKHMIRGESTHDCHDCEADKVEEKLQRAEDARAAKLALKQAR